MAKAFVVPDGLLYARGHYWLRAEGDVVTVGLTDRGQRDLGDVIFVELRPPGVDVRAGDAVGTIESVKATSEVRPPVSGRLVEANGRLETDPGLVNAEPYGRGWLVRIEPGDAGGLDGLLAPDGYRRLLSDEA
jgi:glycine cleavage system H protein